MISHQDSVKKLAWQVFLAPAERGLLFGVESSEGSDENVNDAFLEYVRFLLPESEYGLQVVRIYAAPGLGSLDLRRYFTEAIASKMPRHRERLLVVVDGFDLLRDADRLAHLEILRLGLRLPSIIGLVTSKHLEQRELKFFDQVGKMLRHSSRADSFEGTVTDGFGDVLAQDRVAAG